MLNKWQLEYNNESTITSTASFNPFLRGPIPPSFCYFRPFHITIQI